jgi:phosphatidate cytidylyltransferase
VSRATGTAGRWSDLVPRFGAASVLASLAIVAMWAGGWPFRLMIAAICTVMLWELARMLTRASSPQGWAEPALVVSALGGGALVLAYVLPPGFALPVLLAPIMAAISILPRNRGVFIPFGVMILLAGWGLAALRVDFGFAWMAWLAAVVIVTDVFGYFAGRLLGGPKFWPKVSPKKTWSGTVAGWIASGFVGLGWVIWLGAGVELIGISVAISMASQMGDMAESAVKRKMGVKDSSSLLPGHGGLFDRFDGMLGAAILLLVVEAVADFPPPPL